MIIDSIKVKKLVIGIWAVEALMDNSSGVDGLHLNGDIATWGELRTGGMFESWLVDFDEALSIAGELEKALPLAVDIGRD